MEYADQAALTIGYAVMTAGGACLAGLILFVGLYTPYRLLKWLTNRMATRLVQAHGLHKVQQSYRQVIQEPHHRDKANG